MKYFHISDQARSLHLVVDGREVGAGRIVCTTDDYSNAQWIARLLNDDQARPQPATPSSDLLVYEATNNPTTNGGHEQ